MEHLKTGKRDYSGKKEIISNSWEIVDRWLNDDLLLWHEVMKYLIWIGDSSLLRFSIR
jgi:hypothetical protein